MRFTIRQKNIELTEPLLAYIESKLLKPVTRLMKEASIAELPIMDIEVSRSTRHHRKGQVYRMAVSLSIGKKLLRAEAENEDIRAACDILEEELEGEIHKFKDKGGATMRRGARVAKKELHLDPAARMYRKGRIRDEGN